MSLPPDLPHDSRYASASLHPLVDALREAAVDGHRRLLDALLRAASGDAGTAPDRASLQRHYLREIGRRFSPQIAPAGGSADRELQRYTRPPTEALEEDLALDALARRLRQPLESRLTPLEQQLRLLVRRAALPIAAQAYAPRTAIEAFRLALEALDLDRPQRQLMFTRYEAAAGSALAAVVDQALAMLARHAADTAAEPAAPAPALVVDEPTLQALRRQQAGGLHRADAQLAVTLLATLRGIAVDGIDCHPVIQRLALLGRLCAAMFEPLPAAVRADVEGLRFTLIKIVLADSGFLTSAGHPLRTLLRDACEHRDERRRRQACARVDQVAMSADFVRDALPQLQRLSPALVDRCLDQLPQQDQRQEQARLGAARRDVDQALMHATLAHARPAGLRLFLRAGWAPLLTQRLLRHGRPSAPWQAALDQLDQLLAALSGDATRVRDFEPLLGTLSAELFDAGMRSDRCERLMQGLREAYYELRQHADAAATPAGAALPGVGVLDLPEVAEPKAAETTTATRPNADDDTGPDLELFPVDPRR